MLITVIIIVVLFIFLSLNHLCVCVCVYSYGGGVPLPFSVYYSENIIKERKDSKSEYNSETFKNIPFSALRNEKSTSKTHFQTHPTHKLDIPLIGRKPAINHCFHSPTQPSITA